MNFSDYLITANQHLFAPLRNPHTPTTSCRNHPLRAGLTFGQFFYQITHFSGIRGKTHLGECKNKPQPLSSCHENFTPCNFSCQFTWMEVLSMYADFSSLREAPKFPDLSCLLTASFFDCDRYSSSGMENRPKSDCHLRPRRSQFPAHQPPI